MQLANILILNHYYLCYLPINKTDIKYKKDVRPVISLKNNSLVMSGTGSETDPWIIE